MSGQDLVKQELTNFMQTHLGGGSLDCVDEIVLQYMTGVLEDLGTPDSSEDSFDVDQFVEMMDAYQPGFGQIDSIQVCEWMFNLAGKLTQAREKENTPPPSRSCTDDSTKLPKTNLSTKRPEAGQGNTRLDEERTSQQQDETEEAAEEERDSLREEFEGQVRLLCEMFPSCASLEAQHCLVVANGDMEHAVQLVMERQQSGECMQAYQPGKKRQALRSKDDGHLKKDIIAKYSYVDVDDDTREHRPIAPKSEPKKLVRYLDSQVVSKKGERYTEVKSSETEDMKKTYVNLKPARKYRFH
ncbi:CUEDC2 [Branchiostoma lanceolatum]|uniref:CUEDC2 protein n=1 Tax=Branchiostoma lanceolatum TaxID=7740 RepID=A0A8K0EUD9_BRALA|nr:CUEDC2 [Branchiostoma lanceolatum]